MADLDGNLAAKQYHLDIPQQARGFHVKGAAGLDRRVAPFAALYVLVLSILSPLASARSGVLARLLPDRLFGRKDEREQPSRERTRRSALPSVAGSTSERR